MPMGASHRPLKKINDWQFFDNQAFENKQLDFGSQTFYGDGWVTSIQMILHKAKNELKKVQHVKMQESYEPRQISFEANELLEIMREKETDELLQEKLLEQFTDAFTSNADEEDGPQTNRYTFDAFEKVKCERHRNQVEIFNFEEDYFIVSKSFNHALSDIRLVMQIHKYSPGEGNNRGSIEFVHEVKWPIVSRKACIDPSMISVM